MAPKKKEKERVEGGVTKPTSKVNNEIEAEKANGADPSESQQGLPIAFERHTKLYRYLAERHRAFSLFLHRNLTYMRGRMSRNHKLRKTFKIDSLYLKNQEKIIEKQEKYMTLTFLGLYDKSHIIGINDTTKVETSILKTCYHRRKDIAAPVVKVSIMTSEVPINPREDASHQVPIISISPETINVSNQSRAVKTYTLAFHVQRESSTNGDEEGLSGNTKRTHLEGALTIYNAKTSLLLLDGDYDVLLKEVRLGKKLKHNRVAWTQVGNIDEDTFGPLDNGPTIKFRLEWTREPNSGWVDRPPLRKAEMVFGDNKENRPAKRKGAVGRLPRTSYRATRMSTPSSLPLSTTEDPPSNGPLVRTPSLVDFRLSYTAPTNITQFLWTKFEGFRCPWCRIDCLELYSLLKHLRLNHARFNCVCSPKINGSGYQISVSVNESYDGAYEGSPYDLLMQPSGAAFAREGPIRRTSITQVLVCRPKRPKPSLTEFLEAEDNVEPSELQRPSIVGHNRLYHHTTTNLPVLPAEMDYDSEGEKDPKWLQQKTVMMIDDFTDVNEGEKELLKLWNLHVMKWGYVGDCQIPTAHSMFINSNGKSLLRNNLYRNFVLHLCNLYDFNLLPPPMVHKILVDLQQTLYADSEASKVIETGWLEDRKRWLASGGANGPRDKTGQGFSLSVVKSEPTHPKMAASSTFISGDGTLRRKMTQQTPQSVKKGYRSGPSASSTPTGISKAAVEKPKNEKEAEDVVRDISRGGSSERALRKKRKLSLEEKVGDMPAKRKRSDSLPSEAATNPATHFRRKSTVPAETKSSPSVHEGRLL